LAIKTHRFMVKHIPRHRLDKIAMKVSRFSNNITDKNTQNVNAMAWFLFEQGPSGWEKI